MTPKASLVRVMLGVALPLQVVFGFACTQKEPRSEPVSVVSAVSAAPGGGTPHPVVGRVPASRPSDTPQEAPKDGGLPQSERTYRFSWSPPGADSAAYRLDAPEDQHQLLITAGVPSHSSVDVLIAMHGQPRRGELPRNYTFGRTVTGVVRTMVEAGRIEPMVVALPVFRFQGENWPGFDLRAFIEEVRERLTSERLQIRRVSVVGHSGAAGCGGQGLNRVFEAPVSAVGFFDTCVGPGFVSAIRGLERMGISTLIVHSVETAGYRPRQPVEYLSSFDFGRVYRPSGLRPSSCPTVLPEVPLRALEYRCASNPAGTIRALVVDTGEGEPAHQAVVPVALRYFLEQYVKPVPVAPSL